MGDCPRSFKIFFLSLPSEKNSDINVTVFPNGITLPRILFIYSNKKETSDFHGTVSFDPGKMSQQK